MMVMVVVVKPVERSGAAPKIKVILQNIRELFSKVVMEMAVRRK